MNWGNWIRTSASRYQKPLPYRLAIPQKNSACSRLIILHRSTQTGIEPVQPIPKWLCINHCTIKFGVICDKIFSCHETTKESMGFEPTNEFYIRYFLSKEAPSATRPTFHNRHLFKAEVGVKLLL